MSFDPFRDSGAVALDKEEFDPFKSGAAVPIDDGFDPFASGAAIALESKVASNATAEELNARFKAGDQIGIRLVNLPGSTPSGELRQIETSLLSKNFTPATGPTVQPAFMQPGQEVPESQEGDRTIGRAQSAARSFVHGVADTALSAAAGLSTAGATVAENLNLSGSPDAKRFEQLSKMSAQGALDARKGIINMLPKTNPEYAKEFWSGILPSGVGSAIPFAVSGYTLGPAGSAVLGSLSTAQQEYEAAREAGMDEDSARKSFGVGALIGLTEAIGVGRAGAGEKIVKTLAGRALSVSGNAIEEGAQEALQQFLQNLNAARITGYDPNRPLSKDVLESGAAGLILGGVVRVAGLTPERLSAIKESTDPGVALTKELDSIHETFQSALDLEQSGSPLTAQAVIDGLKDRPGAKPTQQVSVEPLAVSTEEKSQPVPATSEQTTVPGSEPKAESTVEQSSQIVNTQAEVSDDGNTTVRPDLEPVLEPSTERTVQESPDVGPQPAFETEKTASINSAAIQGAASPGAPLSPASTPSPVSLPIKSQREIIRDLAQSMDVPIRFGRLTTGSKFAGYFKKISNLVASERPNDLPIATHEVGHKIDSLFSLSSEKGIAAELDKLGDPATPGSRSSWTQSKSRSYKMGEGVAELMRYWLTDPAKARSTAPNATAAIESIFDANPDVGDTLRQAQQDIFNWRNAPAEARLASSISVGDNPNKTPYRLKQLTRDLVDDLHMLRLAVDDAERLGNTKLKPSENPYLLARLLRGSYGMADTFIRSGVADFTTRKVQLGTSFEDAMKPVAGRIDAFRRWIVAKRAQELHAHGRQTGLDAADVNEVAKKYDNDPAFQEAFQKVKAWNDSILRYAVDSGLLSDDAASAMRTMNQDYVPFHRVFEIGAGEDPSQQGGKAGRGLNVGTPASFRKLAGSSRDIVDPLETMIKNAYVLITASEKSAINAAIGDLSKVQGMARWVEDIATPKQAVRMTAEKIKDQLERAGADLTMIPDSMLLTLYQNSGKAPFGENIIRVVKGGEAKFYRLKSELFDVFNALDLEDSSRLIEILSQPAQVLRAGVTLTPDFALSNLMRDAVSSAVINRFGMLPFEASIRGISAMIKNPQLVAEWAASGGNNSIEADFFDRKKLSKFMREKITKDLSPAEQATVILKSPLSALRFITGAMEEATRVGEFQKAYQENLKSGMTEGDARRMAAFESRDRQDFAKGGAKTKILRHAAAFWNAQLQANVKLYETFKERPLRTTLQGLAYVTTAKLLEQALNWNDEDYWDRPQWERDMFFLVPFAKDDNGHTRFVRIPTPFEVGLIFGTLPGRFMQWIKTNKSDAFSGVASTIINQTVPNPIPQTVQVVFSDFLSGKKGWDTYRNRPVVPESLANLPPELQFTEQTSLTARKVGQALGFSPMKVDHIITQTTGGLGKQISYNLIDRVIAAGTGESPTASRVAPGMRFFTTPAGINSEAVTRFYDELQNLKAQGAAAKKEGRRDPDAQRVRRMERASEKMRVLRKKAQNAAPAEKQRYYLEIANIAKRSIE